MGFITIENIEKTYGKGTKALQGINCEIEQGSFVVVLGASGAGKSTLLRLINGLETPTSGRITVNGTELTKKSLRKVRASTAMVFQHFNLVNRLNVMTNVLTGRLAKRSSLLSLLYLFPKEDYQIAEEAINRVGLSEKLWDRADQLSGGQQQRVGIARALAQKPKIILADEPVASLDPKISEEVLALLRDVAKELGITIVANLHQVEFAKKYADRIIGLSNGRIVFDGTPENLNAAAVHKLYQSTPVIKEDSLEMAFSYS